MSWCILLAMIWILMANTCTVSQELGDDIPIHHKVRSRVESQVLLAMESVTFRSKLGKP